MSHAPHASFAARIRHGMILACVAVTFGAAFPAGGAGEPSAGARMRPLSLAAADFDADGVRDLACGYAAAGGGLVTVARGVEAAVYGPDSLASGAAPPFLPAVRVAALPVAADLVAAGDFDNDGRRDVVAGAVGGDALYLLRGDGRGALGEPRPVPLPGSLTALACGDVNRIDGLADLVAAVDGTAGPRLLVFEGPDGAIGATPETIPMPARVGALLVGQLDGAAPVDVAAAAAADVVVVHGRDRELLAGEHGTRTAAAPVVEVRALGAPARAADLEILGKGPRTPHTVASALASVPMRLNADAIVDYVVIEPGHTGPSYVLSQPFAVFTVTTTADAGSGSLRAAIEAANASPGADLVDFEIPGPGGHTIRPLSPLPQITDPVTVDATTEPGYAGTPLVEIDGSLAGADAVGLHILAGSSAVRGLVVNSFRGPDLNAGIGIRLESGGANVVEANYLGVDAAGSADRPNENYGLHIYESAGNVVGGTVAAARNVIAGSSLAAGIGVEFSDLSSNNRIQGNYIGTDVTGTLDLNARSNGVLVDGGASNVIGGTEPGARNVISGNGSDFNGFNVFLQGVRNSLVQGNYIGTDAAGAAGVATSPSGNVILDGASTNNTIGGTAAGAANRIGFSSTGVQLGEFLGISNGNAILGNAIFGHEFLGLGLGYDVVTPNDGGDADAGPNNLQNFPVLTSAVTDGDVVTIGGRLNGAPGTAFRVELFANTTFNVYGFGEGETFLGVVEVTTDASGSVDFTAEVATDAAAGSTITATATDASGNTSEFSMSIELELSWLPPDASAPEPLPPPRELSVRVLTTGVPRARGAAPMLRQPAGNGVTAYKVYRSNQPGVQPGPSTFFTSVPPSQTSANAGVFVGGTFFVVTAVYPDGESDPSNEVATGTPPTITSLKAAAAKVTAKGSGFTTDSVLVTADGIPFLNAAAVKSGGRKVVQRGPLITGESLGDYARTRPGGVVSILFRNSTGGVEGRRITVRGS